MENEVEIWKSAAGLPVGFEVSNKGNARVNYGSHTELLRIGISGEYNIVRVNGQKEMLHKLVAKTFVPNPNNYNIVIHKDGNKQNNSADNLIWSTKSEAIRTRYRNKLSSEYVVKCEETGAIYLTLISAEIITGVPQAIIRKCIETQKSFLGLHFKKIDKSEIEQSKAFYTSYDDIWKLRDKFKSTEELRKFLNKTI